MALNWLAVIAAAVSSFVLGGVWYSALFARAWQSAAGLSDAQVQGGNKALIFGGSFVLALIASATFAMFLGPDVNATTGALYGLCAGLCWVGASFGINYLFERKSLALWLINGGYHTVQFTLIGLIFGSLAVMRALLAALALVACATPARAQGELAPLAFLQGCWVGTFDAPAGARDERCYEPMLDGRFLRDRHTVVGAGYSGETIYGWNGETQRIEVTYYANDGAVMTGRVALEGDQLWMRNGRYVSADGSVLNLRSHWIRNGDGFAVETEQDVQGAWRPLIRITYVRAP